MPIINVTSVTSGLVGVLPSLAYINTSDTIAAVQVTGYLNKEVANGAIFSLPCMALVSSQTTPQAAQDVTWFEVQHVAGNWSLVAPVSAGAQDSTALAAPGTIRAFTGKMVGTATVMTSGNLVGVRGEVDAVGASGGFLYGVQGKVIPTGTLSGSSWTAGVFGQLDISHATINAGQLAPIWGDYGSSSGTLTNQTGLYGIAMTNTTAAVLEGQLYLYGGATNLMYLNTNAGLSGTTYFKAAGTGASSWGYASYAAATEVLQISVNGTTYYIPCKSSNA